LEKALVVIAASTGNGGPPPDNVLVVAPTRVFLTLVGGGVFENDLAWIWSAIHRAFRIITDEYGVALEVYFVHYSETPPEAEDFVEKWNNNFNNNNATCSAPL
jgi:xanthine/CO dehydrogenase XdhC/CoxF family maturation factor